LRPISR